MMINAINIVITYDQYSMGEMVRQSDEICSYIMVYREKRRRFMGLYCVDVQNDQLDIVLFKMKITKKLGFEKNLDFL